MLHLVTDTTETLVRDDRGTLIGWVTPAEGRWLAYYQTVFGRNVCCGHHPTREAATAAVRDRQEDQR